MVIIDVNVLCIMLQSIWTSCGIMSSDEDQSIVEDLYVGFDVDMCLVVAIEHIDYEDPEYSCSVYAVVNKEDAFTLSKKLNVRMADLPDAISKSMEGYAEIVNADFRQVQECFKEVINGFISENCPYKVVRNFGKNGFICC